MNIVFIHLNHRRRGGARLVLEWGIKNVEEMGVEMWIDAWPMGKVVCPYFGFIVVEKNVLNPKRENSDETWKYCERERMDLEAWVM